MVALIIALISGLLLVYGVCKYIDDDIDDDEMDDYFD